MQCREFSIMADLSNEYGPMNTTQSIRIQYQAQTQLYLVKKSISSSHIEPSRMPNEAFS